MDEQIIIGLTVVGIIVLIFSILRSVRIIKILNINYYEVNRWYLVLFMLILFISGYAVLIAIVTDFFIPQISLELIVSLVYFFGGIFTFITTGVVLSMLYSILGGTISSKEAINKFIEYAKIKEINESINLEKDYSFPCEFCNRDVEYNIIDIVRSNIVALDRGITVEDIFGTKSYIFRPTHICDDGRREYIVVHDHKLEIRSIENSRIVFGGEL